MKIFKTSGVAIGAFCASMAQAQTPQAAPQAPAQSTETAGEIGDIIVTAQRRSESLQDTPLAVTAVNADVVQKLGLTDIVDIASITPGAQFKVGAGFFSATIRGIGTPFVSTGLEAPVAIYEDGAYLTRTIAVNEILENFDIGSIQVLRGPQGTLYGRNATGGVIIVNTADPSPKFEGRLRAEYGNFDHQQLNAMINIPLGEDLALRTTGTYKHEGGYIRNVISGKDVGGGTNYNVRAKLRWQPGIADIILGGQYSHSRNTVTRVGQRVNDDKCYACILAPGILPDDLGFYEQANIVYLPPNKTEYYGANLSMAFDFDNFTLTSTSTYRRQKVRDNAGDTDGTPLPLFEFSVPSQGGTSYTQDLQVASKLDGPFNYLFGLSYLHDKGYFNAAFLGLAFGGSVDPDTAPAFLNTAKTTSYAAFLEGYYNLTEQLKVTVGGRYTYEERGAAGTINDAFAGGFGYSFAMGTTQRAFTPRFVVAWDDGPTNIYYSFTRGFKAGGYSTPYFAPTEALQPEKAFNHEVGIKQSLFDNKLRVNLTGFYFKNKDLQVQHLDFNSGGTITENAGALENYGVELEAQITPMEGLNMGLSGAWQHPSFTSFKGAPLVCYDPTGMSDPAVPGSTLYQCFGDLTGARPAGSPRWSGSFNASYDFPIGTWSASLSGFATYRSSVFNSPGGGGPELYDRDGSLFLVNASGYISPPGEQIRIGFYANNVLDKKYVTGRSGAQPYGLGYTAGMPRSYGLRLEYRF